MTTAVVIPFRDRGKDRLRAMNLDRVLNQWHDYPYPWVVSSDEGKGDEQFNRSAAYNAGVEIMRSRIDDLDSVVFAESDMLIPKSQIDAAIALALERPGLVVPFDEYHYLGKQDSARVRFGEKPSKFKPEWKMNSGKSIGAINVVSLKSLDLIGKFDERFKGNWYDDDAMKIAFEVCAGPTRWVKGVAHHLYHLPGHKGEHLTAEDQQATTFNRLRLRQYQAVRGMSEHSDAFDRIRHLTSGGS